jgi:ferrous iron transport protein A
MSLSEVRENKDAVITAIQGDTRFMSRITSIGLTPGCKVSVIKNDKNRPMLVYSRDTMIALNRNECTGITVEEVTA